MENKKIRIVVIYNQHTFIDSLVQNLINNYDFEIIQITDYQSRLINEYEEFNPDLILIDLDLTKTDPIFLVKKILSHSLIPIITFNSVTQKGRHQAIKSLEYGAFTFISKPYKDEKFLIENITNELLKEINCIKKINLSRFSNVSKRFRPTRNYKLNIDENKLQEYIITIGASKGGIDPVIDIMTNIPKVFPPVVIINCLPFGYTTILANKLNDISKLKVKEAEHKDRLKPGMAFVAPSDYHIKTIKSVNNYELLLDKGELVNNHRPSMDILFNSIANEYKEKSINIIVSGLSKDGLLGIKAIKSVNGKIITQNKDSAMFYDLIEKINKDDLSDFEIPSEKIPDKIIELLET